MTKTLILALNAFLAGGAIMMIEFIAVRFLQRSFGSSLDVWASEIAVCMAALAVGSAGGGWLVDRFRSYRMIGALMIGAALTCLPIEWLARSMDDWLLEFEFAWWHPLAAAGVSSATPLLLLGAVLPHVVRLQTVRIERLGRIAGGMSAVSTVGGIAGVLATTALLGSYGVRETLWGLIIVLLVTGTATFGFAAVFARPAAVVAAALLALIPASAQSLYGNVIFERYTAYHHILVDDTRGHRIMWFDDAPQSTMSLSNPIEGAFEYCDFFHVPVLLHPSMSRVLFVGLGGGSGPKQFLHDYPTIRADVVEIDPVVVDVAKQYFALPADPRLNVTIADGRNFLRRSQGGYGAIMMDAYASGRGGIYLPYHLATKEFFEIAWSRLETGGCLVYNVVGQFGGQNDDTIQSVYATLMSVFKNAYSFSALTSMNIVFVAQKIEPAALDDAGRIDGKSWPDGPWLEHPLTVSTLRQLASTLYGQGVIKRQVLLQRAGQMSTPRVRTELVMTDNYAPVDITGGRSR